MLGDTRRFRQALRIRSGCLCLALVILGCSPGARPFPDPLGDVLRHPDMWKVFGMSVEDRPIYYCECGAGEETIVILGTIHGDEAVTGQVVVKLAEELCLRMSDSINAKVLFVPVLNPDGVVHRTRTNAHGVDLNRNFPTHNWSPKAARDRYPPGPSPSSEPETRLVLEVLSRYNPRLILSLHAPLQVVNYDGPARDVAERMGALNGYRVSDSIGYATPGSLGTYAGVERQIPIITLELPPVPAEEAWRQNRDALLGIFSPAAFHRKP